MIFSKKAKCSGCAALQKKKDGSYKCKINIPIDMDIVDTRYVAPRPMTKCYKPSTLEELTKSEELMKSR